MEKVVGQMPYLSLGCKVVVLVASIMVVIALQINNPSVNDQIVLAASAPGPIKVYLPIALNNYNPASDKTGKPVLLGLYPKGWMGDQSVVDAQLNGLSDWSGLRLSLAGTFADIVEPSYEAAINMQFDRIADNGYVPFVNLMTSKSAYEVARGDLDNNIRLWARAFKKHVDGGNDRMAFIAPMPEMNGNWTPYGYDPGNFKLAYQRIQRIFAEEGVPDNSVRWVFAPNGWSLPAHNFEYYYPGDGLVDVIGFSAYNYGYCAYPGYTPVWLSLESLTSEYIHRMREMAPSKPIFITQVASSARTSNGINDEEKNQWFREGYAYLAAAPGVRGVIYFNMDDDICDMAMYRTWSTSFSMTYGGYKDAVQNPILGYLSPAQLKSMHLSP